MPYAVYICQIFCPIECRHGQPCMCREDNHPMNHNRQQHFASDNDGMIHEWNGNAGKCKIYDPGSDNDGT